MVGQLTKSERQTALIILLALAVCGLAMAVAGHDDPLGAHGALVIVAALAGVFAVISAYYSPEPAEERLEQYYDDPTKVGIILAMVWAVFGMFVGDWVAWLLVYPDLTFDAGWASFGRLRPVHTTARDLRLRRQRADRDVVLCPAANVARATSRSAQPMVRAARLQPVLRAGRHRLHDGHHAIEGICRARMVRRHLAGDRLGRLFRHLSAHTGAPQGAAHLRGQLVLHGLHPGRRDPAHRQQSRRAGLVRTAPRATRLSPACRMR